MKVLKFKDYKLKNSDHKIQILMRGTIGLTSKSDDEVKQLMHILYKDWVHLVLIKGENEYNRSERIPDDRRNNKIDYTLPILNMTSRTHEFLENPKAKIYNKVEDYQISADKVVFSKEFEGSKYLPKTVFFKKDIKSLKLPIIAKPKDGFSAQGISLFKTHKEAEESNDKFDLWSEAKDIKTEFRLFVLNGKIIHLAERIKNTKNDKSVGVKDKDEKIDLVYIDQNLDSFPQDLMKKLNDIHQEVKKKVKLDFYDIDLILDTDDNFWIPEINGAPGIGPSMFLPIYQEWINMLHTRKIKPESEKILTDLQSKHRNFMKKKYSNENEKSMNPI